MRREDIVGDRWRQWTCLLVFLFLGLTATATIAQPGVQAPAADSFTGHPRVAIISDIGNEPDDQMSFVRLLLYSNELDLEAMIATTSTWQKTATHPETMHSIVEAYRKVSPLTYVDAIRAPIQIFAGTHDFLCPPKQTERFVEAVRAKGGVCEFDLYEGGHGSPGRPGRIRHQNMLLEFLFKQCALADAKVERLL